jgi:hypothetical protein
MLRYMEAVSNPEDLSTAGTKATELGLLFLQERWREAVRVELHAKVQPPAHGTRG